MSGAYDGSGRERAFRINNHGMNVKVGDTVSIAGVVTGRRTNGKVVHIFESGELPGWHTRNLIVEIPTHIDPILEVRQAWMIWPELSPAELAAYDREEAEDKAYEAGKDAMDHATERLRAGLSQAMDALTEIQRLRFGPGERE